MQPPTMSSPLPPTADANIAALIREGMLHHREGRAVQAERAYRQVLALDPGHPEALGLFGMLAGQAGQPRVAIESFERALQRDPRNANLHYNLGETWRHLGDNEKALNCFQRAARFNTRHIDAFRSGADAALAEAGRREAAGRWTEAIEFKHRAVQLMIVAGRLLLDVGDQKGAASELRRATMADPKHAESWAWYGSSLIRPLPSQAIPALKRAVELDPSQVRAYEFLGSALTYLRLDDEARQAWQAASTADPRSFAARPTLTLFEILPHYEGGDRAEFFALHRAWGEAAVARQVATRSPKFKNDHHPERRLRVGYVSPDLRTHSVATFFEPLVAAHDRAQFEIFCFSAVPKPREDHVTARFRTLASHWRDIADLDDTALRRQVRSDQIDVLVDLGGHFRDSRIRAFAAKPAPVTASWLGYPGTTGLPNMDWRITDSVADPPGAEIFHTENLIRLNGGFLCFQPPDAAPDIAPLPAMAKGSVTFGSFNNQLKINRRVIAAWARILMTQPDARLLIKSELMNDDGVRARLHDGFIAEGIEPARIELLGWMPGSKDRSLPL
jgi:protein O-GlcNAc transferase